MFDLSKTKIAVVGLGYVGLPVAAEFGKHKEVIGYDIDVSRIKELSEGFDKTRELTEENLKQATLLSFTHNKEDIKDANVYIVTVPTPIDDHRQPDLGALKKSSAAIAECISKGDVIIYESTVYPGATEEVCVPILEEISGLSFNQDFYVGYSPERINPGDKTHTITNIKKITSGSTPEAAGFVDDLYRFIITAGTHKASSIKVAEAAKVIENTQRDLNIALVNELAIIFEHLNIDTHEVLAAAKTKWNFLPFVPGLVGGHCIGVDPYYLTYKAQEIGYDPEVILAGRKINDRMGSYIVSEVVKHMIKNKIHVLDSNVLVLGLAFKENCPDVRNTRVVDIVKELHDYGANVDIYDPWVNAEEVYEEYNISMCSQLNNGQYDAIILAVAHKEFCELSNDGLSALGKQNHIVYDVKSLLPVDCVDGRL